MEARQVMRKTAGGAMIAAGYAARLASWGLTASSIVLNGAVNISDSFVKAPETGLGKALIGGLCKGTSKLAGLLIKKGRGMAE